MKRNQKIQPAQIKKLRGLTGAGVMDCKEALIKASGDLKKATQFLRKRGLEKLEQKSEKVVKEGLIHSYIHSGGRIGVLVEVNCETDFVARNKEFKDFVHNLAMHIAASNPRYVSSLLEQPYIRNLNIKVKDYLGEVVAKIGESIKINRFTRYELGK